MTISLERSLRHMAWANQKVYSAVSKLPDEALGSYIVNPQWTAGEICQHIAGGSTWFVFCLGIEDWIDIPKVSTGDDVKKVAELLHDLDSKLIKAAGEEDRQISHKGDDGVVRDVWFSSILSQAIHHATEHRAQLIDALEFKGFTPINLDHLDFWAFDAFERNALG